MERVFSVSEARANFSELVSEAGYAGRETVITRNNRPIAVIIGYEQYLALRQQACASRSASAQPASPSMTRSASATPKQSRSRWKQT